jgi:hypothetical protein
MKEQLHFYLEKNGGGSGWRANRMFVCGKLLEKYS